MADTAGQALIQGINIDTMAIAYEEEVLIFKKEATVTKTNSRSNRWYQRTSGYLTATAPAKISPIAYGSKPFVLETSWTRNLSSTKKYMLETPMITMEDETDSEVQVFTENVKAVIEAISNKQDSDIWDVATENVTPVNINTVAATAAWNAGSGQDPNEDVSEALQVIREQTKRKLPNPKLYVNAQGEKDLKVWTTSEKGTLWNELAGKVLIDGVLSRFAGCEVVVNENVASTFALVGGFSEAVEYKEFAAMKTAIITEELVGRKVRASTEGVAILRKPKFLTLLTGVYA